MATKPKKSTVKEIRAALVAARPALKTASDSEVMALWAQIPEDVRAAYLGTKAAKGSSDDD